MKTKLMIVGLAVLLSGCATSKSQQVAALTVVKGELEKSHDATCDEIKEYLTGLETVIQGKIDELK